MKIVGHPNNSGVITWDIPEENIFKNVQYEVSICTGRIWNDRECNNRELVEKVTTGRFVAVGLTTSWSHRYAVQESTKIILIFR